MVDSFIQNTKKLSLDPKSNNFAQITTDLKEINRLMEQNIREVLDRGGDLDRLWLFLAYF